MKSNTFEIRDLRQADWVWTNKAVLFHTNVDASAYKVYCGISSYAGNEDQRAFPGIQTLADRLHLGRNTVMRALETLEAEGLLRIEKEKGLHNIYYLLSVPAYEAKKKQKRERSRGKITDASIDAAADVQVPKDPTPRENARMFFDGIEGLMKKEEVPWLADLLRAIAEKNSIPKGVVWQHVKDFGAYWTEKNPTGTKERWEMQKTFEVQLRLGTWFRRAKVIATGTNTGSKARGIIGFNPAEV